MLALGAFGPQLALGIRPQIRVSYALPARVDGTWSICTPGTGCPALLFPPLQADASRLELTAGVELPVLSSSGPVRPYLNVGAGIRRYGFSWEPIGMVGSDTFVLERGTLTETNFLLRFGGGAGVALGRYEATFEGGVDFSSFATGGIATREDFLGQGSVGVGGSESVREFSVTAGLRRYLN